MCGELSCYLQRGTGNKFHIKKMGDINVISGDQVPSISTVTSLNDRDFKSLETPDDDTADSKDVVFMR